jgi:uncharacterized membrane protein YdjX (TVP38/TMEM64 family)
MKKIIRIGVIVVACVLFAALFFLRDYFTLENLKLYKDSFLSFVSAHYFLSVVVFFLSSIVWVNSPVPLVLVMSIASGLLFGFVQGAFFNIFAVAFGASAGFWMVRYLFRDCFYWRYSGSIERVDSEVEKHGFSYFFALRAALVCPYFLINILGGLSKVNYFKFFLSTALGYINGAIIYSYSGSVINEINSPHDLFGWKVVSAIVLIVLLSLVPVVVKKIMSRRSLRHF